MRCAAREARVAPHFCCFCFKNRLTKIKSCAQAQEQKNNSHLIMLSAIGMQAFWKSVLRCIWQCMGLVELVLPSHQCYSQGRVLCAFGVY